MLNSPLGGFKFLGKTVSVGEWNFLLVWGGFFGVWWCTCKKGTHFTG